MLSLQTPQFEIATFQVFTKSCTASGHHIGRYISKTPFSLIISVLKVGIRDLSLLQYIIQKQDLFLDDAYL